ADYNTISNCTIDLSTMVSTTTTYGALAISGSLTSVATTTGTFGDYNTFTGNTILGNPASGPYYGIRINGSTSDLSEGNVISDNTRNGFYMYCIYAISTDGTVMSNNDITRSNQTLLTTTYGSFLATKNENGLVEKNKIHHLFSSTPTNTSTGYGIYLSNSDQSVGQDLVISNNAIYDFGNNGINAGYYVVTGSDNHKFLHNTIALNSPSTAGISYGIYHANSASSNVEWQNNIISVT